jgi:tetratricopeptide (TPR) repeat protein
MARRRSVARLARAVLFHGDRGFESTSLQRRVRCEPDLLDQGHYFFARRFEDAAAMLLRSIQEHPGWAPTYRFLAACYAHMGRLDEAREAIDRLKSVTPVVVPNATHWRNPEHRELFLSGLRLAAGEDT